MPWRLHPSLTYVARLCEVVCEHGSLTRWSHLCDMNLGMTTTQTGVIVVTSPTQKPQICGCVDPRLCAEGNDVLNTVLWARDQFLLSWSSLLLFSSCRR